MNNIVRKTLSKFVLAVILIIAIAVPAFAASSSVTLSFNTGTSGNAYVDGAQNNVYHKLDAGNAYLSVSNTSASSGVNRIYVVLKLGRTGPDKKIGTAYVDGIGTYRLGTGIESSSKYYLYASGTGAILKSHHLDGKLKN